MSYHRGGGVSAAGGMAPESRHKPEKRAEAGIPYLKILIAAVVLLLLGLSLLALSGFRP
jgi:hypothetical protein